MTDEFDELLGDIGEESWLGDFPEVSTEGEKDRKQDSDEKAGSIKQPSPSDNTGQEEDGIPKLVGIDYPEQYQQLAERIKYQYRCLPKLNYNEIYEELSDLAVKSHPSPTLQMINDEIQRVQAAKERLAEIYRSVERNYYLKKRSIDILESAWAKYTTEKSADKRKGDALFRVSNFVSDFALTEACYKVCQHIIKTLDSSHDSLSRQITVNISLLKMNDYGRSGGLPEYDMDFRRQEANESETDESSGDPNELEDSHF